MPDTNTLLVILNGLLAVITGFYAWATFRILKANEGVLSVMEQQTEKLTRPYVQLILYMVPGTNIFALRIENTGRTAAIKLRLSVDRDFFRFADSRPERNLRSLNAFSHPIASFGPGARIDVWLAQGPHLFGENPKENLTPVTFMVEAAYEFGNKSVIEETTIDFRPYLMTDIPREPLAQELKDIKSALEDLPQKIRKP